MSEHQPDRPRFGKIPEAKRRSGRSRSRLYELAAEYPGLFRKDGKSTVVDLGLLDSICEAFPTAEIKAPAPRKQTEAART
jgi:hypothetical protein